MTKKDLKYIAVFGLIGLLIVAFGVLRAKYVILSGDPIDSILWLLAGPVALATVWFNLGNLVSSILFVAYYSLIGYLFSRSFLLRIQLLRTILVLAFIILHAYIGYSASEIFREMLEPILESLTGLFERS